MSHVRRAAVGWSALAVALLSFSGSARATDPASATVAANAVTWLKTQQVSDGGFGFGTADAALAIAEQAQSSSTWSTSEALAAVQAVTTAGKSPLDFLEADAALPDPDLPGKSGKAILLTAIPLGIDPTNFGGVNLVANLGGCSVSTDPTFNGLLYVLLAEKFVCASPSATGLAAVRAAQRSDGGWNYLGDQDPGVDSDNDTTAVAIEALVAGGASASDPNVHAALVFFAQSLQADGAWQSFGADDPNSTALAVLGIAAVGFDPTSSCWRDTVMPAAVGTPYSSPDAWLRSQQLPDGRIQSPNDAFPPINTFATSQAVEGLLRSWLPAFRATAPACATAPVVDATTTVAAPVVTQPAFTG